MFKPKQLIRGVLVVVLSLATGCDKKEIISSDNGGGSTDKCIEYIGYDISNPTHKLLRDIVFADATTAFAVGDDETIMRSVDSGTTWTRDFPYGTADLWGVDCLNADSCWTAGGRGLLRHTLNGGDSWASQTVSDSFLIDISVWDAWRAWTVGQRVILSTENGGGLWSPFEHPQIDVTVLYAVEFGDGTHGWAVGLDGTVLYTDDGGDIWVPQQAGGNHLLAVDFVDIRTGWAVGLAGEVWHTTDGGSNWSKQTSGVSSGLHGVSFYDQDHGMAIGDAGLALYTENGGDKWQQALTGTPNDLLGVFAVSATEYWACGDHGTIVKIVREEIDCP